MGSKEDCARGTGGVDGDAEEKEKDEESREVTRWRKSVCREKKENEKEEEKIRRQVK